MPVLETDFLKGLTDPSDKLHARCNRVLSKLKTREWYLASTAFLEFDLLLKSVGTSEVDRASIFIALSTEIPRESILGLTHQGVAKAIQLQLKYGSKIQKFYFDSLHIATAILSDGVVVSSDNFFDQIQEVKRISL